MTPISVAVEWRQYDIGGSDFQVHALPHKKSYPKGTMPQNKNLTQINPADGGIGGLYGVFDER
ncbi:MAG: hypothetical protein LBI67_06290, partial [Treponema sp.]|nr:hypothetical protein [Treponema sp.]